MTDTTVMYGKTSGSCFGPLSTILTLLHVPEAALLQATVYARTSSKLEGLLLKPQLA